jgi:alpha/beta superfamily hydrolase
MIPVRFGGDSREVVGFYHPPAQAAAAPAVLICNPFGQEALRSYRMLRLLADRLAAAGCAVLRFDYYGTGDSPGDDESASLVGWAGDIGSAHRELAARSGKSSIAWVGLRLGASLCAMAAQAGRAQLKQVVMWDPVIVGSAYLESLALHPHAHAGSSAAGAIETMGFTLPDRFRQELRGLNVATLELPGTIQATIILGAENDSTRQWRQSRAGSAANTEWIVSGAAAEWNSDKAMNTVTIPAELLRLVQAKVLESVR